MEVFAGNPGFTYRPGPPGSMIISFLKTLHAHIIVGSHEGRELCSVREVLKFLASEILKLLLNMWNHHCYFYVPLSGLYFRLPSVLFSSLAISHQIFSSHSKAQGAQVGGNAARMPFWQTKKVFHDLLLGGGLWLKFKNANKRKKSRNPSFRADSQRVKF